MDSITKTKISEETIKKLYKKVFKENISNMKIEELTDGYFNTAYLISLDNGFKTILKISPPENVKLMKYEKDIMWTEVETLRLIKERTNVPVPKVYYYDDQKNIICNNYFFMEFIKGQPLNKLINDMPKETVESIYQQIGMFTKEINNIEALKFGYISQKEKQFENWSTAFLLFIEDVLSDGEESNAVLPYEYSYIRDYVKDKVSTLDTVKVPKLVHKDLWSGNIFVDVETNKVTSFIDCERAVWGDPLLDFVFGFLDGNPSFIKGYNRCISYTEDEKTLMHLYRILLYLILIIECKFRLYPTDDQEKWGYTSLQNELKR